MLNIEKTEVLAELDKAQRTYEELWCEREEMKRGTPDAYQIQDYLTRLKDNKAEREALKERLRKIKQSESESKPNEPKHTPPAKSAANSTPHRRRDNGSDNGGLFWL